MAVKMIIATDEKYGIGKDNQLLCHNPEDMKQFRTKTLKQSVVMGGNTYRSIGEKGLPNRCNIVLTREVPELSKLGYIHSTETPEVVKGNFNYIKTWLEIYKHLEKRNETLLFDYWIIGGAEIYKMFLDYVDEVHWTLNHGDLGADTFLDMTFLNDKKVWEVDWIQSYRLNESSIITVYKRIKEES